MSVASRNRSRLILRTAALAALAGGAAAAGPTTQPSPSSQFASMSLEDLMNVQVTSVSKQQQSVGAAPAAVTVITQEDIRRSGMERIPELLRLSPGLDVAQVNANQWAISSRGFNDLYANKLLVLMDGRTVYYPPYSGVYWDSIDYVLPDLDRIEVIRGPGATLWGANAVNGVINIMTRPADQTQGFLTSDGYSTQGYNAAVRYGGQIDDRTYFRVYGKTTDTDNFHLANGSEAFDGEQTGHAGFRIDRYSTKDDTLTVQGDIFQDRAGEMYQSYMGSRHWLDGIRDDDGENVLARWKHVVSKNSDWTLQAYLDRFNGGDPLLGAEVYTADLDFQHRFALGSRQEIVWGAGARYQPQYYGSLSVARVTPDERQDYILNAFIQDDITLSPDLLHVILGSKLEQSNLADWQLEPSIKAVLTPSRNQTLWASVSRAVSSPSRLEEPGTSISIGPVPLGGGATGTGLIEGSSGIEPETMTAFEAGYRVRPAKRVTLDLTGFANLYDDLVSTQVGTPYVDASAGTPALIVPLYWTNVRSAEAYGLESAVTWNLTDDWKVVASHTLLLENLHLGTLPGDDPTFENHLDPQNQLQLRTYYNVGKHIELNAAAYYVEQIQSVPSYVRLDLGVTWRPKDGLEVSLGVQNLLDNQHPEFTDKNLATRAAEVPRTVYGQVTWRF